MLRKVGISLPLLIILWTLALFAQNNNEEFRATWVVTWDLINSGNSVEENQALAREILDNHKQANMNAVLWQVRQSGTAYYNSSYEPWGYYAGYQYPGYDPLAYAVEQAHERGLELHAWFNVFACASTYPGTPAVEHPEWICRDRDGNPMTSNVALSPGLEEVREYLINVAMEVVRNYDIDGLHLDYIRWNEYTNTLQSAQFAKLVEENRYLDGMITQEQIDELNENPGGRYLYDIEHPYSEGIPDSAEGGQFPSWEDWWRWSVTEFVRVLHDSIQAVKPWVRLSVAALGKYNWSSWQGYGTVYQDAALWFNEGFIDQLTPMHYHWTTGSEFYGMLTGSCPQCWGQWIQQGISDGRLYSVGPGSYALSDKNVWNNHPQIVETCRTVPWVDGFQFFRYGTWKYHQYWEKARSLFFNTHTKIRATGLIDDTKPDPPKLGMIKIDSLAYQFTVKPSNSEGTNFWYVIYRSEDAVIDTSGDEIVDIHFGNSIYTFIDSFPGTQDFNGQYYYSATQLDRYWNESPLSNTVFTDSIPSFAPTVFYSSPSEGDTVKINTLIRVTFSKTMDITSVNDAINLSPTVNINQTVWTSNYKTLTISFDQNLEYATEYTLIIDSSAVDINGVPIDGNGDGRGGDAFVLHFTTEAEDTHGPTIVQSYPDLTLYTYNVDVEDVITIVFDEAVDGATINDTTVTLTLNGGIIDVDRMHTVFQGRSVLSIRPVSPFNTDTEYSLTLSEDITDLLGNPMDETLTTSFRTSGEQYSEITMIDDFTTVTNWKQPGYSGSTVGILAGTEFGTSSQIYLPATSPYKSAKLTYVWDESAPEHLLREYLAGGSPRDVWFDTTYTLQCYVFGDGSYNKFRFCVDDHVPNSAAAYHEVSPWIVLDWIGWRLIEWDLDSDPVGNWIGNGILEGTLRIDSFQLTYEPGSAASGVVYFDNFRVVKKSPPVSVTEFGGQIPEKFALHQNYPNPFNTVTVIPFELPSRGKIELVIYDLMGRQVKTLMNEEMSAGYHTVIWSGNTDSGSRASSGVYLYILKFRGDVYLTKRMMLLK